MDVRRREYGIVLSGLVAGIILLLAVTVQAVPVIKDARPTLRKDEPVRIKADSISYDRKSDVYVARGNVEIVHGDMVLMADSVILNNSTRTVVAEGKVEVSQRGDRFSCERIDINIDTQTGRMERARIFYKEGNVHVSGKEIIKLGEDRYRIIDGSFTTCDGDLPDWSFHAKEADITVEGYAHVRESVFLVRNLPILYSPYIIYPVKTKRQSGFLTPSFGQSTEKGYSFSIPFFWAVSENMDLTFFSTYYTKRGYRQGMEYRYALSESTHGISHIEYIKDMGEVDPTVTTRGGFPRTQEDRWWVKWDHRQLLPLGIQAASSINRVSDNYYLEDFAEKRADTDARSLKSTINFSKTWGEYNFIADFQHFQNLEAPHDDNSFTLHYLPRVTFSRSDQPILRTPVYLQLNSSGTNYYRDEGSTGQVLDISPKFSIPVKFRQFFQFSPYIQFQETAWHVENDQGKKDSGNRITYGYGGRISTELYRVYRTGSNGVRSLRHSIQPSISYDVVPYFEQKGLPNPFVDRVLKQEKISYSMTNYLTGKVFEPGKDPFYHEYVRFVLSQSYDILEERRRTVSPADERRPFSEIEAEMEVHFLPIPPEVRSAIVESTRLIETGAEKARPIPHRSLYLYGKAKYNIYDSDFSSYNLALNATDLRGDTLNLRYKVTRDTKERTNTLEELSGYLKIKALDTLDLFHEFRRDMVNSRFTRYTYGLDYHPQCWSVQVTWSVEPGFLGEPTKREIKLLLTLYGLGPVLRTSLL